MYVAFTRAVERLHVITTQSISNKQASVAHWVSEYISAASTASTNNFYEIGKPENKQAVKKSGGLNMFDLMPLSFSTPKDVVRIKASYLLKNSQAEDAKKQGILVHWLLSRIKTADDVESALEEGKMQGLLNEQELPELRKSLQSIIEHPDLKTFFKKDISLKLEAELITSNGEILRPDRIAFTDSETALIDYKTGKENNTSYFKQLLKYEEALHSMGYPNIKKYLVYVDNLNVVRAN